MSTVVVVYFAKVAEAKISKKIGSLVFQLLLGLAMAVAAIVWAQREGTLGAGVIAPTSVAIMLSTALLFFVSQRMTPVGDLKVKVGDKLLAFASTTSEGVAFNSEELAGRRILLKFFRGGW
jgi:hypothetical protein